MSHRLAIINNTDELSYKILVRTSIDYVHVCAHSAIRCVLVSIGGDFALLGVTLLYRRCPSSTGGVLVRASARVPVRGGPGSLTGGQRPRRWGQSRPGWQSPVPPAGQMEVRVGIGAHSSHHTPNNTSVWCACESHLPHPPTPPTCHTHLHQRHSCECVHGQPSAARQSNRPRQTTCPNNGGSSQHTLEGGHWLLGNCMISIITQIHQHQYHHSSNHSNQRLMNYVISHDTSLKDVSSSKQWMDTPSVHPP